MSCSNIFSLIAIVISIVSAFYTYKIDKKNDYNQCIDETKEISSLLYATSKEYARSMNRYLAVQSSKYESDLRNATRAYSNEIRRMLVSLKKYNCDTSVKRDLDGSLNMVSSSVLEVFDNKYVDIDLIIKSLDQISKYKYHDKCCH